MPTFFSKSDIIARIKQIMWDKRLTQKAMAKELGVSEAYFSDVMNGRRGMGTKILQALGYGLMPFYRKERREL